MYIIPKFRELALFVLTSRMFFMSGSVHTKVQEVMLPFLEHGKDAVVGVSEVVMLRRAGHVKASGWQVDGVLVQVRKRQQSILVFISDGHG